MNRRQQLCLVFIAFAASYGHAQDKNMQPEKLFEPREYAGQTEDLKGQVLKYRLLKPAKFDPNEKYPLVIFLHGAGERGDNNTAQLKHGMADFCDPAVRSQYPCYVLAPQCPENQKWADVDWVEDSVVKPELASKSMQLTLALVDEMLENAAIDRRRIYITGLSMGGYGTWDAVSRRPGMFAAAVPVCGGGDPATAPQLKTTPIWCFHGSQDNVVIPELSRRMVEAITAVGGEPKYTEYPGAGHDSWTATYANREVMGWIFEQRRPVAASKAETPKMQDSPK